MCTCPVSFLGGVSQEDGRVLEPECESRGVSVADRVFCFPFGKGSTVGSYVMYQLKLNRAAPCAIVNGSAEPIVVTGAVIADVPMIDGVNVSLVRTGDRAVVDADSGTLELKDVAERHVVTSIVRNKGRILLLKRSADVGSYRGQWAGVSGYIEHDEPDLNAARREIVEEVGIRGARMVRRIPPEMFRDMDTVWCVHPFLFEAKEPRICLDWEHEAYEWVAPEDVAAYPTVPGLQQVISKLRP